VDNLAVFPSAEWMKATQDKLNTDEKYAQVAKNWEGDMRIVIEPGDKLPDGRWLYWNLYHGTCLEACIEDQTTSKNPAFVLNASYPNVIKVLSGEVSVMQALMTRMVSIRGNFGYVMRNIPVVLDFVRCCQEVTHSWE
jgi:putative sterol carrier protein